MSEMIYDATTDPWTDAYIEPTPATDRVLINAIPVGVYYDESLSEDSAELNFCTAHAPDTCEHEHIKHLWNLELLLGSTRSACGLLWGEDTTRFFEVSNFSPIVEIASNPGDPCLQFSLTREGVTTRSGAAHQHPALVAHINSIRTPIFDWLETYA